MDIKSLIEVKFDKIGKLIITHKIHLNLIYTTRSHENEDDQK